jgi:uncharacterized repeat protein (TIGR03803 family)
MNCKRFLGPASAALMLGVVIFMLAPGAWAQSKYKTLYRFHGTDGAGPDGSLIFDAAGNLYGTTYSGGKSDTNCYTGSCGTTYELMPNADGTWTHKVIHYFTAEDTGPDGGVTFDTAGNLYGMTNQGPHAGNVYELVPTTGGAWSYSVLYQMGGAFDGNPAGGMTFDAAGNLYGTSAWGCGYGDGVSCVFEMTPSGGSWTFNLLYGFDFTGSAGWYPSGTTPIFDAKGNLYATTAFGGNSGCSPYGNGCYGLGVVFELTPSENGTWTEQVLHAFTGGKDGESPACPLVFDAAGNLYGTTYAGGAYGKGNIFKLTPNADGTWTLHVLHQFTGGKDGSMPLGNVIFDAAGNLYGTTNQGGANGYGVVFKLTPILSGGWGYSVLHHFRDLPGAYPGAGLALDTAGNLYGTTAGDGTKTFGSVFEITP